MQPKQLQNFLGIGGQTLVFLAGTFRGSDFDQFHFVELMDANDPARFTTGRTRFPAKTRCVGNVFLWQFIRAQDFFAVKICYRHFRSRGEKELIIFQSVHIGFEFWEL